MNINIFSSLWEGNYLEWNNRLAKYFFNEEMAGREVLLYINEEIINNIGDDIGNKDDFVRAVKEGPEYASSKKGFCQKAYYIYKDWRNFKELEYPPYVAYLALFVLAENVEGDFDGRAYYPRLNKLLGNTEDSGVPSSFYDMWELWIDLEKWSKEGKGEELGFFSFRIRGGYQHVGLPLSQTILSNKERDNLPFIFSEADLDPMDPPPIETIKRILLQYGNKNHLLEKRTLKLLDSANGDNALLKNTLLEFVLDELSDWDQTVPDDRPEESSIPRETKTGLRICLDEDKLSRKVKAYLRFKTNHEIPNGGLTFKDSNKTLTCLEANANWSSPLRDKNTSENFNASHINWNREFHIKDIELNWHAKLKASNVRLFCPGEKEGLSDWIEFHHLERQGKFMVAVYSDMEDHVRAWGSKSCEDFQKRDYMGLPVGWSLFYGKNPAESCENIESLTLSSLLRIHLRSGIKTGRGNTYLEFGLPSVELENSSGSEKIKINGEEIARSDKDIPMWELHGKFPICKPLRIEVYGNNNEILQKRIIRIEEPHIKSVEYVPRRGPDGEIINDSRSYATGAIVSGTVMESKVFEIALPAHLSTRIIFLGSNPGEIKDWPGDEFPSEWHPVWALSKEGHKQWTVYFCGKLDHLDVKHIPGKPLSDRRAVKRWKEAIWVNRKLNQPPTLLNLSEVWRKYMEAAKNA